MPLRSSIRWRSREHGGLEQLRINEWPESIKLRSAIVSEAGDTRHGVFYEASLTPDWVFESILLQRTDGVMSVLSRGRDGAWFDAQVEELPHLKGCIDIDFEMTPFTNTLPIRRTSRPTRSSRSLMSRRIRGSAIGCTGSRTARRAPTISLPTSPSMRMGWWSTIPGCSNVSELSRHRIPAFARMTE